MAKRSKPPMRLINSYWVSDNGPASVERRQFENSFGLRYAGEAAHRQAVCGGSGFLDSRIS